MTHLEEESFISCGFPWRRMRREKPEVSDPREAGLLKVPLRL